jgi:hypothetical protein
MVSCSKITNLKLKLHLEKQIGHKEKCDFKGSHKKHNQQTCLFSSNLTQLSSDKGGEIFILKTLVPISG